MSNVPRKNLSQQLYSKDYDEYSKACIEDIHFFLLNMAFISPSELENIYIS